MVTSRRPAMRAAFLPVGIALALAPAVGWADPPSRLSMRLDYARGDGGEACPAQPKALRAAVAERMGYDPFDLSVAPASERLAVVLTRQARGFAARVERVNADGEVTWSRTFPKHPLTDCAALTVPLAIYVHAVLVSQPEAPAAEPAEPAAPAAPAPAPTPPDGRPFPVRRPSAPKPPEPPSHPQPRAHNQGPASRSWPLQRPAFSSAWESAGVSMRRTRKTTRKR